MIGLIIVLVALVGYVVYSIYKKRLAKENQSPLRQMQEELLEMDDFGIGTNSGDGGGNGDDDEEDQLLEAQVDEMDNLLSTMGKELDQYQPPVYDDDHEDEVILPKYDADLEVPDLATESGNPRGFESSYASHHSSIGLGFSRSSQSPFPSSSMMTMGNEETGLVTSPSMLMAETPQYDPSWRPTADVVWNTNAAELEHAVDINTTTTTTTTATTTTTVASSEQLPQ